MKGQTMEIEKVTILGAGTMGLQIGLIIAAKGFAVCVFDPFEVAVNEAKKRLGHLADKLAACGRISEDQARQDRFAALHFHDCQLTNVVDIMPHSGTSEETLEVIRGGHRH